MADVDVVITIPDAQVATLKHVIEYAYAAGLIPQEPGIDLDQNGKLSPQETLAIFTRETRSHWRRFARKSNAHEINQGASSGGLFDDGTTP